LREENDAINKLLRISKVSIGMEFAQMFKENKTLLHVDLSHNNFKKVDCEIIEEGLKENHTLFGIHMIGNEVNTNS
jgi:hypothetical protein